MMAARIAVAKVVSVGPLTWWGILEAVRNEGRIAP